MGGHEPRRIVAGGSHGGNADAVLVAVDRAVELTATDHHVPLRPLAICRFGVELDADGIGVETTKENLDADVVSGVLRRRPKCAEARVRPGLGEGARPAPSRPPARTPRPTNRRAPRDSGRR